ncbi:MAG: hypothetical protein QM768_22260 [Agriterribacter sp.]
MKCRLTFDAISGYFAFFVFTFLVTLGISFFSDWKVWYITLIAVLAFLGVIYCALLIADKSYRLVIDETGITFRCMPWLIAKPKFVAWTSVVSYYNYTYPFDHEVQPEYLMLVCTNGKKEKITISGLDHNKDEIFRAVKQYYSSARNPETTV